MNSIKKIEKEIIDERNRLSELEEQKAGPLLIVDMSLDSSIVNSKHKVKILEAKRGFLLQRRESWLPKTIWNFLVPIVVTVFTTYILIHFGMK